MPTPLIQPYLFFNGRCEEAIEFYRGAVGAKAGMLLRFTDSPVPMPEGKLAPGFDKKVMHAEFTVGDSTLLASDGMGPTAEFKGFALTLMVATEAEARKAFNALAVGGKIQMPLTPTFYSPCFGMVTDKFGLGWMVMVPAEKK